MKANRLVISLPYNNLIYLKVFDSTGRKVWNTIAGPEKNISVNLPVLPTGVYRVMILSKDFKKVVPFISYGRQ